MNNFEMPRGLDQQKNTENNKKDNAPQKETKEQEREEIRRYERDLVVENPDFVGINFDHDDIVNPRNYFSQEEYAQFIKEKHGEIPEEMQALVDSGKAQQILSERRDKETGKIESFKKYLASFNGKLQHVRVHPYGEFSPVVPSQAIEIKADKSYEVAIAPEFFDQMRMIQAEAKDLTIVIQFYDHRRGNEKASDVPETQEQKEQYVSICEEIIEILGDNLQLEIGNETNISKNTDKVFADVSQHASRADSSEYGSFFYETAKKIKEENPQIKLSIAGIACFDPTYLREVLGEIKKLQTENGINMRLVDTISFHPYRGEAKKGALEVKNGKFNISKLNYEEQLKEIQKIASEFEVELTVGEINFKSFDPERGLGFDPEMRLKFNSEQIARLEQEQKAKINKKQENKLKWENERKMKLEKALSMTAKKNIKSFIYPGVDYR